MNKLIQYYNTISLHKNYVTSLISLKDGRIASASYDGTINIYNPKNNYYLDIVIQVNKGWIYSLCQLEDENIVSTCENGTFLIWSINKN